MYSRIGQVYGFAMLQEQPEQDKVRISLFYKITSH